MKNPLKKALSILKMRSAPTLDDKDFISETDPVQQFLKMDFSHFKWLKNYDFKSVLDVGANQGQFAYRIRSLFPEILICSFEPIPGLFDQLNEHFRYDKAFMGFNYALGETEQRHVMYLNEFSPSSSLLELAPEHKKHFNFATKETPVEIRVTTLDKICAGLELPSPVLIKIDVQGYEEQVIAGGSQTLKKCFLVIIEVSFRELYQNQPSFDSIYRKMTTLGFKYVGNFEQLLSPVDGEILQADALFMNINLPASSSFQV